MNSIHKKNFFWNEPFSSAGKYFLILQVNLPELFPFSVETFHLWFHVFGFILSMACLTCKLYFRHPNPKEAFSLSALGHHVGYSPSTSGLKLSPITRNWWSHWGKSGPDFYEHNTWSQEYANTYTLIFIYQ